MSDPTAPGQAADPAVGFTTTIKVTTWAEVANSGIKYLSAGVLFAAIGFFAYTGKVDAGTFVNLCIGGLVGLGVYHGTAK